MGEEREEGEERQEKEGSMEGEGMIDGWGKGMERTKMEVQEEEGK